MKAYIRPTEAERYRVFMDGISVKTNGDGSLYLETYAPTIGGSCRYGQYYGPDVGLREAMRRFEAFYWPLNQRDNDENN